MITPERPLAFRFQFIEIFAGAAVVSQELLKLGVVVGPPIELSLSKEFDANFPHLASWISYMLVEGLLESAMVEPPCTSFSVMRSPPLRSKYVPFGHCPADRQTKDGNMLAHRGFQIVAVGDDVGAPTLLETPNSSLMKNLPSWQNLARRRTVKTTRCDSCAYGSPHLKSFKFLHSHLQLNHSNKRCRCKGPHLKVQGSFTKASATYVQKLAESLALDFYEAMNARREKLRYEEGLEVEGLENQAVNHAVTTLDWECEKVWTFKKESHINLLEITSVLKLVERRLSEGGDMRLVSLIDSFVARGAICKGRSSSRSISRLLRRINSMLVSGGLYLTLPFCPTRHNTSDDPTRGRDIREKQGDFGDFSRDRFFDLALCTRTRRWSSNWMRLVLRITDFMALPSRHHLPHRRSRLHLDFDSTLGFPGEGPISQALDFLFGLYPILFVASWTFAIMLAPFILLLSFRRSRFLSSLSVFVLVSQFQGAYAMDLGPRNRADIDRQRLRSTQGPLPEGRMVLEVTAAQRDKLLSFFYAWCNQEGHDMKGWLEDVRGNLESINLVLCHFGRTLYDSGRPMNHFVETINALTSFRPALWRQVQAPWDIAFNWSRMEPNTHHVAAPFQVIMAMLTVCLMWGWLPLAGALATMWGAMLRPGELVSSIRQQLTLPMDLDHTIHFGILSILEPKTRFSSARHQAARLDIPDLLEIAEMAYGKLEAFQRLWPYSGQTLRVRFRDVLKALSLPLEKVSGVKALDLGSMRAGGATWCLQTCESGELCRRRGRWASQKVMDLYIQEVSSLQYLSFVPKETKERVMTFAKAFPGTLKKAKELHSCSIDCKVWHILFRSHN